jgi:lipopolysaccharide biosynthesis glycosyltransferase
LIYAADGGFSMPLAVSLHSVLRHLPPGRAAQVYIVDGGFDVSQKRRIERVAKRGAGNRQFAIEWVTPDRAWWRDVELDFSGKHLNETVLYRLGVTHFLPTDVDRAIYIDADVLAKTDVGELESQIADDRGVCAARDYCMSTWLQRYWNRREPLDQLGLSGDEPYFNAGVLGINVRFWREHDVADRTARFLVDHCDIAGFYDQDALNYVLRGQWQPVHPGWNFQPTCRDTISRRGATVEQRTGMSFDALQSEAKLIHFTGAKPWDQGLTNPERHTFVKELRLSGWDSTPGYLWWSLRWYRRLVFRGMHKVWCYRAAPKLSAAIRSVRNRRRSGAVSTDHESK